MVRASPRPWRFRAAPAYRPGLQARTPVTTFLSTLPLPTLRASLGSSAGMYIPHHPLPSVFPPTLHLHLLHFFCSFVDENEQRSSETCQRCARHVSRHARAPQFAATLHTAPQWDIRYCACCILFLFRLLRLLLSVPAFLVLCITCSSMSGNHWEPPVNGIVIGLLSILMPSSSETRRLKFRDILHPALGCENGQGHMHLLRSNHTPISGRPEAQVSRSIWKCNGPAAPLARPHWTEFFILHFT
ncbi:hypothetical protein BDW02DRAFT_647735 [Decorospora gaudefroyi]|uniref:Uncharacterized protein n=1 Tax=Decorospora gaudefroyi TaxID=184978 RepID=A0A6A5KF68_9PLEO|nr:hypothetical protein BDW02DRAFT_647735 [Decorospora gaudefroyi]